MKKLLVWLAVLAVIFSTSYFFRQEITDTAHQLIYFSYCDTPIGYRIGSVDPRFDITNNELKTDTQEAAAIWNDVEGKQLFVFDPAAKLTINMTYDERQYLKKQIDQRGNSLTQEKDAIEPKIGAFDQLAANFKKDLDDLNAQIQYWNSQGGAPPGVYDRLIREHGQLQERARKLNQMAQALKRSTDEYNQEVNQLNQTVDTFNQTLDVRPEEGLYDRANQRIDIYFNISKTELVTTIAHELGHALDLEHDTNTKSIMYPKVTTVLKPSANDSAAVRKQCEERNRWEVWYEELVNRLNMLHSNLKVLYTQFFLSRP